MPNASYALIMLVAGICVPLLAALNAALGKTLGAPAAASVLLFVVALLSALIVYLFTGGPTIAAILATPKHLWLAGALIAVYVLSITYVAPHFGVGNAVFFVLLGQMISSAAIDHFGLFGAQVSPLNGMRAVGIAVMASGVALTQFAR